MSLASEVLNDVLEVLEELGEVVTFTRETEGTYSTDTGTTGTGTTTTFSGYGAPDIYQQKEKDGIVITQQDTVLYVRTSTEPLPGDIAQFNSINYRVMNAEKYRLQGTSVLYKLQVRI